MNSCYCYSCSDFEDLFSCLIILELISCVFVVDGIGEKVIGGGGAYTTFRRIVEFPSFYMLESVLCDDLFPNLFLMCGWYCQESLCT